MPNEIQPINNNAVSLTQNIDADVQKALALIDIVDKQDGKITAQRMKELLIDYILANMRGDRTEMKAIQEQMNKVMQTYTKNIQEGNELVSKLKTMEGNSVHSSKDLTYLQSLITALQQDVASGDMSNLYQF